MADVLKYAEVESQFYKSISDQTNEMNQIKEYEIVKREINLKINTKSLMKQKPEIIKLHNGSYMHIYFCHSRINDIHNIWVESFNLDSSCLIKTP